MEVEFKDKKLEELYTNPSSIGFKGFPSNLIKPFRKTIQKLKDSSSFDDLRKFHSLALKSCEYYKDDCFAVRINQQYRLVFEYINNQKLILVLEAVDYHDRI